ncbi:MAG: TetR/AcrR family transcriptional regulator [Pseudomonadota bacterium]
MSDTKTALMDAAEQRMRAGGYHAFSFRDLADDLGIKSASVHYHFRQKEDLGVAVVERYSETFFKSVAALVETGLTPVEAYAQAYRDAFQESETGCLCGMLGAETRGLPERVALAVSAFMDQNIDWVVGALPNDLPDEARRQGAVQVVASLQGALMLAVSLNDAWMLDAIVEGLRAE